MADQDLCQLANWEVAHSSVPTSARMHPGLCPVHRSFIAMSGRSLRLTRSSDDLGGVPTVRPRNRRAGGPPFDLSRMGCPILSQSHRERVGSTNLAGFPGSVSRQVPTNSIGPVRTTILPP